jgi:hypothetical protein
MIYYEKLKSFCEGLEMENIDELLKKSPEFFNAVGKTMTQRIKERTSNYRTTHGSEQSSSPKLPSFEDVHNSMRCEPNDLSIDVARDCYETIKKLGNFA